MRSKLTAAFDSVSDIFDEVLHRLVHLAEIQHEDEKGAGGQAAGQHQANTEPQDEARADGDDDVNQRREPGFDGARPQTQIDALLALTIEAILLELLPGERLDDACGGDRLLDDGGQLAFFLLDLARGLLDPACEAIHHHEEERRH